jgi:hypothetical protein
VVRADPAQSLIKIDRATIAFHHPEVSCFLAQLNEFLNRGFHEGRTNSVGSEGRLDMEIVNEGARAAPDRDKSDDIGFFGHQENIGRLNFDGTPMMQKVFTKLICQISFWQHRRIRVAPTLGVKRSDWFQVRLPRVTYFHGVSTTRICLMRRVKKEKTITKARKDESTKKRHGSFRGSRISGFRDKFFFINHYGFAGHSDLLLGLIISSSNDAYSSVKEL